MAPVQPKQALYVENERILLLALLFLLRKQKSKAKRKHRFWVSSILQLGQQHGAYANLVKELGFDGDLFKKYMRLSREQFARTLYLVERDIVKHGVSREAICPREHLAICIRYLATGESFRSIGFSYRVGESTVSKIVSEVCQALWKRLSPIHMAVPLKEDWQLIASNFEHRWHFPHCLGAIDGKHVVIRAPQNSGSLYRNYKGTFSIVLLALVSAHLHFICIDVGSFGRNSDGGIFSHSNFGKLLASDRLDLPEDSSLPGALHLGPMPYVFVGDEAFPLQKHLLRPFPGKMCPIPQQIFNYRLSRARRVVENAFGLLAARWRIFHTKIDARPQLVVDITKAACVLHNMLQSQSTPIEVTSLLEELKGSDPPQNLLNMQNGGNRAGHKAVELRDVFMDYFCNVAPMPWQMDHVTRGMRTINTSIE